MSGARADLRLLAPAGAAWLGASATRALLGSIESMDQRWAAGLRCAALFAAAAAAVSTSVVAVEFGQPRGRANRSTPGTGGAARPALAIVVATVTGLISAAAAALSLACAAPAPIAGWADARATAHVLGVVTGEPRLRNASVPWQREWQQVSIATTSIQARGSQLDVEIPVTMRLGPDTVVPPPGTQVHVVGRLAPARSAGAASLLIVAVRMHEVTGPGPVDVIAQRMRTGLRVALAERPAPAAALVAGLAVGDESGQDPELTDAMQASGLAHLTAVSGGNIAILLAAVVAVVSVVRRSLRVRAAACLLALAGFTVLVGPQPSVLRAVAMGVVVTIAVLVGGRRAGPSVLSAGVLVLVITQPWLATSWGFALSVLATAAIVLLAPTIADRLAAGRWTAAWPRALREASALTVAAQVGTLPVLVAMGGAVGWVAVPANLLAAPLVPPVTILGLLAAVTAPILPGVAEALALVASWPAAVIASIATAAARAPLPGLPLPAGPVGVALLGGLVVVGALVAWARPRLRARSRRLPPRWSVWAGVGLLATAVAVAPPSRWGWPPADWIALMCDVGQGSAFVLRVAPNTAVVVDTGPDPEVIDRCLADAQVDTVPAIVLTHFHADHVGGLSGVLRGRAVGVVLVSPVREPADQVAVVERTLTAAGVAWSEVAVGEERAVGILRWRVLWPRRRIADGSVPNNGSVVLLADVAGTRVLLTGDIESAAQAALGPDLRAARPAVVTVPHHGSADVVADLAGWLRAQVALVSVGVENEYGHPAARVLADWRAAGALVARTDESGDVAVVRGATGLGVVRRR